MQAKHILWIFDACFSGTIIEKLRGQDSSANWQQFLRDGKVRRIITSGSAYQQVPDESVFADVLVRYLKGQLKISDGGDFFTGAQLSSKLQEAVIRERGKAQTPQAGTIRNVGQDEGDIVFQNVKAPLVSLPKGSGR
jgi:hypothetical protein